LQYPPAQSYPFSVAAKKYSVALIIKNIAGCIDSITHTITVKQGVASIIDSILPLTCSPNLVALHFSNKLACNSIAHDGSNFSITGPSNVSIDSTSLNCTNGETDTVHLALSSPINTTGTYLVKIKRSSDNSQINNVCNILTQLGTSKNFNAYGAVSSAFTKNIKYGCKQAAITFKNGGVNGINHWLWNINDSTSSTNCYQADTTITYTDLSDKKVNLIVSNPACTDPGSVQTIKMANYNDTVKAGFIIEKNDVGAVEQTYFICPVEKAIFKDTSIGDIKYWLWTFGNGLTSTEEIPSPQSYQAKGKSAFDYPVNLIVRGNYCSDTTTNFIKIIPNCLIDVPRAFTPNGDNLNDYLYPLNAYKADNLDFKVFNRFGQLVFETRDWTIKWDGKIKGADPIVGTYIWTLTYTDHDTKAPVSLSGTTVLIK
jgi:gliding motility-associated-like protein